MKLQIWHNSNFGSRGFEREVESVDEAIKLLDLLADYDLYQGGKVVANAQGLCVWNEQSQEWDDYEDEEGRTFDEIRDQKTNK